MERDSRPSHVNEGYSAEIAGAELSREAIRLGRLLLDLLQEPEVMCPERVFI